MVGNIQYCCRNKLWCLHSTSCLFGWFDVVVAGEEQRGVKEGVEAWNRCLCYFSSCVFSRINSNVKFSLDELLYDCLLERTK